MAEKKPIKASDIKLGNTFNEKVWKACLLVPEGKVTTYREIGRYLKTKAYRAIGTALSKNPFAPTVPCHRVIRSDSTIGGFSGGTLDSPEKIRLLKKEGIKIIGKDHMAKIENNDIIYKFKKDAKR